MSTDHINSVRKSIEMIPEQIKSAWETVQLMPLPQQYREANYIVFAGMGGSALGGRVVKSFAHKLLRVPLEVITGYNLPEYVDEKSLVIVSSYSGNTEETVSALSEALKKNAMIFVITTGGKLLELATKEGIATYNIDTQYNPSGQPRMGVGYTLGALLSLLSSTHLIYLSEGEIDAAVTTLRGKLNCFATDESEARSLSSRMNGKIPVLVASEHLYGIVHVLKNQLNETAKSFSTMFDIPELNHHLMEGLANPKDVKSLLFILIESNLYHPRIIERYSLTKEVIEKNGLECIEYKAVEDSRLQQVFEVLALGSNIQLYLANEYKSDPTTIPWVDYFKNKLS